MTAPQVQQLITLLAARGVAFAPGLSESELTQLAQTFGVVFPPDLQLLLQKALPVSPKFAPWRYALNSPAGARELRTSLAAPLEGMLFDVKVNLFWYAGWGVAPPTRCCANSLYANTIRNTRLCCLSMGIATCPLTRRLPATRYYLYIKPISFITAMIWPLISQMNLHSSYLLALNG